LLVRIPADVDPIERGERFEDPINRALRQGGPLGRVVGGGTQMCLGGRRFVTGCHLDVDVKDLARSLPILRQALLDAGIPRGTRVINSETDEVLLISPAAGVLRPPLRRQVVSEVPWTKGEVVGYRLSPDVLTLLFVRQAGRYPIFRVLDWSGPAMPAADAVRGLLDQRERRYALGGRLYAIGWEPVGLTSAVRLPGRLDARCIERSGLVLSCRERYMRRRICAFGSWPDFDRHLRQLFGLEPTTAEQRMMNDLGVGSLAHHFAIWSATAPVTPEQAYQLFAAYVRKDRDRPIVPPTEALRQFVRDLRTHFNRPGMDEPWANKFRAAEGFMIVPIYKSRVAEVRAVLRTLARRHGLLVYEPHTEEVFFGPPVPSCRRYA
jgi:hypothetical protein